MELTENKSLLIRHFILTRQVARDYNTHNSTFAPALVRETA